jgi:hypothetical protein
MVRFTDHAVLCTLDATREAHNPAATGNGMPLPYLPTDYGRCLEAFVCLQIWAINDS